LGQVIDLERGRVEALARELAPALRRRGSLVAETADLDDVERWRRAARRAGRMLGWRMRTGLVAGSGRVWAVSEDFPVDEAAQREAMRRVKAAIDYGDPPLS
jgi:hypothetical protein